MVTGVLSLRASFPWGSLVNGTDLSQRALLGFWPSWSGTYGPKQLELQQNIVALRKCSARLRQT